MGQTKIIFKHTLRRKQESNKLS